MSIGELFDSDVAEKKFQIIENFYRAKHEDLATKTDLTERQINGIIKLELFNMIMKEWDRKSLDYKDTITEPFKAHRISKNREGRIEMVDMFKGREETEQQTIKSRVRNFLGI